MADDDSFSYEDALRPPEQAPEPEPQQPQQPPQQHSDGSFSYEDATAMGGQPETTGLGVGIRSALRGVVPTTAAILGGGAIGAAASPFVTPVGGAAAGLVSGAAIGAGVEKIQNSITDALGLDSEESRAQDFAQHPTAAMVGGLAPAAISLQPGKVVTSILDGGGVEAVMSGVKAGAKEAAIGAGVMGGANIGIQAATQGPGNIDWGEAGVNAALGGALSKARPWAERATGGLGEGLARGVEAVGGEGAAENAAKVRGGFSTGDIDPTTAAGAKTAGMDEGAETPPTTEAPPAATPSPPEPVANEGFKIPEGGVDIGAGEPVEPMGAEPTPGQQAVDTSRTRSEPTALKDLPYAEDAEPLEGGHEEITPRNVPEREIPSEDQAAATENVPIGKPESENFGGREVAGQNENAGKPFTYEEATAAEDQAIATMRGKPRTPEEEGVPHPLSGDISKTSELPEAPPPLWGQWKPNEEVAQRFQEFARIERLNKAADVNDIIDNLKAATGKGPWNSIKAMLGQDPGTNMRAIHEAVEGDDLSKLTPKQKQIWEESGLKDMLDKTHDWFQKEIDAGRMVDRGQTTGLPLMSEKEWLRRAGEANAGDPIAPDVAKRNLNTRFDFSEDPAYRIRDSKGNTQIVTETDKGFKLWDKGKSTDVDNPTEMSLGAKLEHDGKTWTVEKPTIDELEKHVADNNGELRKYIRSPVSVIDTRLKQMDLDRNTRALDLIKTDPAFNNMRTTNPDVAKKEGMVQTKLEPLRGMYFDPEVAAQLNSFHIPGMDFDMEKAGRAVAAVNRFLVGSMFWNPVPHTLNTAAHWFVGRGGDWFNPKAYPEFFRSSRDALREVLGGGPAYREYLRDGAPLMWPAIRSGDMVNTIGRLGEVAIQQDPKAWNQIAKTMGLNTGRDLVKLWYQGARQVLWQGGDILAMQRIMELERRGIAKGVEPGQARIDAIQDTRIHLPDYTIPYKVMGQTWLSKLMLDPRNIFTVFNRYHMGVFKSLAKIVHDTTFPNTSHDDRMKAVGNALALVTLAYVVHPALAAAWQGITGNKNAEPNPRGPLAPLSHLKKALHGEESYTGGLGSAATLSPFAGSMIDLLRNQDWRGKTIVEPKSPFHQQLAQFLGHYGADQISPVKTFGGTMMPGSSKGSFMSELGQQLGDFKTPTVKQVQGKTVGDKMRAEAAQKRARKPQNILEYGTNKLFGSGY